MLMSKHNLFVIININHKKNKGEHSNETLITT
jgi:hypothetical protein